MAEWFHEQHATALIHFISFLYWRKEEERETNSEQQHSEISQIFFFEERCDWDWQGKAMISSLTIHESVSK